MSEQRTESVNSWSHRGQIRNKCREPDTKSTKSWELREKELSSESAKLIGVGCSEVGEIAHTVIAIILEALTVI